RHADCRQRKLADFLCTGGIIQGLIRRGSVASGMVLQTPQLTAVTPAETGFPTYRSPAPGHAATIHRHQWLFPDSG
ncbi:hypothetical protein C9226_17450, partial [Escherichia coli]